jgi:hypothetical protein
MVIYTYLCNVMFFENSCMEKLFLADWTVATSFDVLETQSQRHSLVVPIVNTELLSDLSDIKVCAEALAYFLSISTIRFNGNRFRIWYGSSNNATIQRQRSMTFDDRLSKSSLGQIKDDQLSLLEDIFRRGQCAQINKGISEITHIGRMAHCFFQLNFCSEHRFMPCKNHQVICFKRLHILCLN